MNCASRWSFTKNHFCLNLYEEENIIIISITITTIIIIIT